MRHRTIRSIIATLIAAATITAILIVTLLIFQLVYRRSPETVVPQPRL